MKVLFINTFFPPDVGGGAEITLRTLVQGVQAAGHEVVVLRLGDGGSIYERVESGIRIIYAPCRNVATPRTHARLPPIQRAVWHLIDAYNPLMGRTVAKVCRAERPSIVSCHNLAGWSIAVWRAVVRESVPLVQVLHDYYLLCPRRRLYGSGAACSRRCVSCQILRAMHRSASAQVGAVVGISRFVLRAHKEYGYFSHARIARVLHNARNMSSSPHIWQAPDTAPLRFGFLGSLAQPKGIETLLASVATLDTNVELHVAGTGEPGYSEKLRACAPPNAIFYGQMPAGEFLRLVDCLVVPSLWSEPLGMVVPEAMAHGLPVIAARVGGLPEMIADGENGFLYDPAVEGGLTGALVRMLENRADMPRMGAAARESARPFLDVGAWVSEYLGIYSALQAKS